jgi:hypothetical protein
MIDRYRSVQAYFADALDRAALSRGVQAGAQIHAYLVRMLERFGRADQHSAAIVEPLALLAQRASQASRREAAARHRELGDIALFVGGFFAEILERRGVSERYVHELGEAAYLRAAELVVVGRDRVSRDLLIELGGRFREWIAVLDEVRAGTAVGDVQDVTRLVERWLGSRRPAHAARLIRRGVTLVRGPDGSQ